MKLRRPINDLNEKIILSAVPKLTVLGGLGSFQSQQIDGGRVGVNCPDPRSAFQVQNPELYRFDVNDDDIFELDDNPFVFINDGGSDNRTIGGAYREGSRINLDGRIEFKFTRFYNSTNSPIIKLKSPWRSKFQAIFPCYASCVRGNAPYTGQMSLYISDNGVYLRNWIKVRNASSFDNTPTPTFFSGDTVLLYLPGISYLARDSDPIDQ